MFGGLFVSPKTRLTNYLVETLDEFFEIDRDSIQSNLLSDTRIVLQNVGLRSLLVDNNKELTGSIEKIEFAWKWGGDETTQFIKQVVLTIDGPHFRLRPTPTNTSCPTRSKQEQGQAAPAKDQEPTGYIQGVVQQVIDHLTLRIVDLELTVETLQGDTLTVCSENVELKTKATESSLAGLSQELSVTSLSLSVQENNLHHSLLDPVSYSATVTRTSGQRFVSGATRGLTVQGNSLDATICLHVNVAQAQVLGRVVELFLDTEPVSGPNLDLDPTATTITLPLPALTIRLPHTTIQTSDSMFCCRMDGSLCDFTGSKGIYLDGGIPFFEMGDGVSWKIDLKSSRVSLNGDAATGSMASLAWDEAEMKKLLTSCQEVVSVTSSTVMSKVEDTVRSEIESLDSSWSVSIPGSLSLAVSGSDREFLEVNLSKPFVKLHPDGSVADLSFDGFNVFPTNTFGELSLKIPSAKVTEGNLSCHDSIQLKGESEQCLLDLAGFVQRLLDTGASSPGSPALSKNEAISLPFGIIVQSIELMASGGSGTSICVEKFRLSRELAVSIDLVEGSDNRGASFKAKRVNIRGLNLYESVQCTVGTVENACLPGMFELESPVIDFCCHYRPGNLSIRIPKLEIKPLYFDDAGQRNTTSSSLLLPLVVQVDIGSISSSVTQSFNAQVDFARIRARLEPRGTTTHIELAMPLSLRFVDTKGVFVDMSMDSFQCDLDHCVWSMTSLTGRNMYASMSDSIGPTAIAISRIVGSSEALSIKGGVKLSMESTDNADSFREFVQRVVPGNTNSQSETSAPQLPSLHCDRFEARIEKLSTTLTISDVSFQCNIVKMASVALWDDFEMFCSAENISIPVSDVGDFGEVQIDRVLTCRVPYTFELQSPIQAVKARFSEGAISSTLPNCNIRLLKPKKLYDAVGANQNLVPCPIQITIGSLSVFFEDLSDLSLAVTGVDSLIVPGVGLSISNEGPLSARLSHSTGKWLDARLAGPFLVLKPTLDGWQPDSLSCDILQLGPSSACHIDFRFPCLSMLTGTATIRIDDNATACLTNPSDLLPLYTDFEPLMRFYEQDGAPPSRTKVVLPQLSVECIEPRGRVAIMGVQVSSADLNCAKLHCRLEDGGAASVEGVAVAFDPGQISIASIAELRVPGGLFIEKSIQNISVAMGEEIAVQCNSANLVLLRNDSRGGTRDITLPDLARPVHLSLGNIAVRPAVGSNDVTLIDSIEWRFASPGSDEKLSRPSIAFSGTIGTVKNKLLNASAVKMSGFVHEGSPTVISRFTASLGPTSIVAGFSNVDWLGTFGGNSDAKSDPVSMPNAHLAGTTLHLAYNGMLVGAETSVRVEEFDGRPSTTSDDIIDHIKNAVMKKVPSFVTNAKFMGESVTDSTARGIGMAAMSSGLTGATMGSVTGLVAADSVRGAIAVGKQARGAEKNDGYKFGTFRLWFIILLIDRRLHSRGNPCC